jgi:hypothetical protein
MHKIKFHRQVIAAAAIFLLFFLLYITFSLLVAQTGAFSNYGIFFELDTPRVVGDMTVFDANHHRTKVHPLFVLLTNPAGMLLSSLFKSDLLAAIFLNSFFGALGVFTAFVYFYLISRDTYNACLLACFFGLTTSQFFLSVIPETGALSILSLMVTYTIFVLSVKYKRDEFWAWIFAGLFTFAITSTNLVQTLICFTASSLFRQSSSKAPLRIFGRVVVFLACVLVCGAIFSKIQKVVYPSAGLFYLIESYEEDFLYTSTLVLQSPLTVILQLLRHSFLVNIIAPYPDIFVIAGQDKPALTFSHSLNYMFVGWLAIGFWLTLLTTGAIQAVAKKQEIPLRIGFTFIICLLFNYALHSIYGRGVSGGMEYFPYIGNFSFLVLSGLAYFSFPSKKVHRLLLGSLALLTGVNNVIMFMKILDIYQ